MPVDATIRCADGIRRFRRGFGARLLVLLLISAPGCLWFLPLLRGDLLLAGLTPLCDQWHINAPFAWILGGALHEGRLPLWTDRIGGGYPLLALGEAGVLYPPHLLLYRVLPPLWAFNINTILTVVWAHATTYLLCRNLGRSRAAAFLAGLAYSFCGYFVVHITTLHSAQAAAWTPALLLAVRRAVHRAGAGDWVLFGVVLAVQISTGYPQIVYYSLLAALLLGLWEVGAARLRGKQPPETPTRRLNPAAGALLGLAFAGALAAPHLLPGLELTRASTRSGGIRFDLATQFSYPPANLLTFVAPFAYGNPARGGKQEWSASGHFWDNGYLGLIPLALAAVGLGASLRRGRPGRFFALLFLFSMLVVLGRHTPFFRLLWNLLPGMAFFRFPSRFIAIADLALAVLAAYGLDQARARLPHRERRRALVVVLLGLTALDLGRFAGQFHRFAPASFWLAPPRSARVLRAEGDSHAVYYAVGYLRSELARAERQRGWMGDLQPFRTQNETLPPNTGVLHGFSCLNAFVGLETKRAYALYPQLSEDLFIQESQIKLRLALAPILARLGAQYLVTPYPLADDYPGMRLVSAVPTGADEPAVRVFALEGAQPRLWVPRRVRFAGNEQDSLAATLRESDPAVAVIEGRDTGHGGSTGELLESETGAGWARARVSLPSPGYVVHNQRHYPGWEAWVDGARVPLRQANYLMQAAPVPAGEHRVEFRFCPASYRVGRAISLTAIVLLLLGAVISRGRRR